LTHYLQWMDFIKQWLSKYDQKMIEKLEEDCQRSILKLVDQALYIMCSINLKERIKKIIRGCKVKGTPTFIQE